jgi:ABC-type uncharacterized transport system permease subunit
MGRLMRLLFRATYFHFQTHWANRGNFWSGILGMVVNNALTLLGIWAMLFAGKEGLTNERDLFFLMNFVLMTAYGIVHAFLGGIANLDKQINEGGLDLAMATPRSPVLLLSLTASHLPAWGDLAIGLAGLIFFALRSGPLFFFHCFLITSFATLAMFSFLLSVGALSFWFRRTEAAYSMLINMFLAFNTYPMLQSGSNLRWMLVLAPALLGGMIPAEYLLAPSLRVFLIEAGGSVIFGLTSWLLFQMGMKRYQSASVLGLQRT